MDNQVCEYCGNLFNGHKKKYCSDQCRKRAARNVVILNKGYCKVCCKDISHRKASSMYCSFQCARIGNRLKQPTYTCTYCCKKYKPLEKKRAKDKTDYTFCSISCKATYLRNGNLAKDKYEMLVDHKEKIYRAKLVLNEIQRHHDKIKRKELAIEAKKKNCEVCGKEFISTCPGFYKTCSHSCNDKLIKRNQKEYSKTPKGRQLRRISKARRRARMKTREIQSIDPIKVFKRDYWTCQLCGVKAKKKYRGTYHNNAPELDHIIPLSKGGTHTYDNVQCLCRKCNQLKSDHILIKDLNRIITPVGAQDGLCANR